MIVTDRLPERSDHSWTEPAFTPVQFLGYRQFRYKPVEAPPNGFVAGTGQVAVKSWESSRRLLAVDSASGGTVSLRSFWFPGWEGTMDGAPLTLTPSPQMGLITFAAPAGPHEVSLRFGATPVRRAADVAGMAALVVAPLLAWGMRRRAAVPEGV